MLVKAIVKYYFISLLNNTYIVYNMGEAIDYLTNTQIEAVPGVGDQGNPGDPQLFPSKLSLGCNPSIQKSDSEDLSVQGYPGLHRSCLKVN